MPREAPYPRETDEPDYATRPMDPGRALALADAEIRGEIRMRQATRREVSRVLLSIQEAAASQSFVVTKYTREHDTAKTWVHRVQRRASRSRQTAELIGREWATQASQAEANLAGKAKAASPHFAVLRYAFYEVEIQRFEQPQED